MNELKFSSQVCTTKIQSQRLLELGLKPETADMYYAEGSEDAEGDIEYHLRIRREWEDLLRSNDIPAWSLHRLLEIYNTPNDDCYIVFIDDAFNDLIDDIEWRINKGYLNKEYLKQ